MELNLNRISEAYVLKGAHPFSLEYKGPYGRTVPDKTGLELSKATLPYPIWKKAERLSFQNGTYTIYTRVSISLAKEKENRKRNDLKENKKIQAMDLESSTSVEEVNLEGLHLDTDVIYKERLLSINGSKKRKTEESLDAQDLKCSNESNGCEETLKKRKRENPKPLQDSTILKQATDELDLMCKIWVMELRRLPLDQQLFARKAVCDVLFEARLGQLNKDSVRINRSDLVQNYLTCVHEEHGKVCACPNAWKPQQRCPTSSSQMYPGQPHCYSRAAWKGNLSSPHRPPFFATFAVNRFAAPATFHCPRGPRVGRPLVITTAISITTTTIVVVTPRLISATAPSASASNQVPTTGPSRMHSVNITPYRVENTENSASNVQTTRTLDTTVNNQDTTTHSSIPSNTENQGSELEQTVRSNNSTKPTVNTSTTPTINTLCDVRMDTVTTDN